MNKAIHNIIEYYVRRVENLLEENVGKDIILKTVYEALVKTAFIASKIVKHTTHMPKDPCGQVHYNDFCLCHYCPHYLKCRVQQRTLMKLDVDKNMPGPMTFSESEFKKYIRRSKAARKILMSLLESPKTVRELSIATSISARHVYRVVKKLRNMGIIVREAELIRDTSLTTDGRTIDIVKRILEAMK